MNRWRGWKFGTKLVNVTITKKIGILLGRRFDDFNEEIFNPRERMRNILNFPNDFLLQQDFRAAGADQNIERAGGETS